MATIPEVPGASGHGSTRLEAATGAAADALLILKNESEEIWKATSKPSEKMLAEVADDQSNQVSIE